MNLPCPICGRQLYITPSGAVRCEEWNCPGSAEGGEEIEKRHPELAIKAGDTRDFGRLIKKVQAER